LPVIVSPLRFLLRRRDIDIVLVSVEAWPDEIVVRMRGLPTALTAKLGAEFHEALVAWHREGRGRPPPDQPADEIFDFDVFLGDDSGTQYRPVASARGGTGTMFRADWTFVPGPPEKATSLLVRVGGAPDGVEAAIELPAGDA
jgi:hypothetical protein